MLLQQTVLLEVHYSSEMLQTINLDDVEANAMSITTYDKMSDGKGHSATHIMEKEE